MTLVFSIFYCTALQPSGGVRFSLTEVDLFNPFAPFIPPESDDEQQPSRLFNEMENGSLIMGLVNGTNVFFRESSLLHGQQFI